MSRWACNIDKRGRIIRLTLGVILIGAGIYLILARDSEFWGSGLIAIGAFAVFEGIRGWCALRSLGVDTPF